MGRRVRYIFIINLRRGSLAAEYEIVYENTPESATELTEANLSLVSGNQTVTVLNQTVSATSLQVNDTIVTKETLNENVCPLFKAIGGCGQGFHCENQDGKPICVRDETKDEMAALIIAAVCSAVVLFIIIIFVCIVARYYRNRKSAVQELSTDDSNDESRRKDFRHSISPYLGYSNWRESAIGYVPYHVARGYGPFERSTQGSERQPNVVSVDLTDKLRNSYYNAAFKSEGHLDYRR